VSCPADGGVSEDDRAGSRALSLCQSFHTITREVSRHTHAISPSLWHFTQYTLLISYLVFGFGPTTIFCGERQQPNGGRATLLNQINFMRTCRELVRTAVTPSQPVIVSLSMQPY